MESIRMCRPKRGSDAASGDAVDGSADRIRDVAAGSSVGYGQTWTAAKRDEIGTGSDRICRWISALLSNRGTMMVAGQPAPVAGRVSMDLTVIDLAKTLRRRRSGDEVTVMDDDPISPASVISHRASWPGRFRTKSFAASERACGAWRQIEPGDRGEETASHSARKQIENRPFFPIIRSRNKNILMKSR